MKLSNSFFITRKEFPNDEESLTSKLLVKSGMIYKNYYGIYTYLPMGFKVIENIKRIIREEHNKSNIDELMMPSLIDDSIFKCTNRIETFSKDMFRFNDRDDKSLCLCPTSEELFASISSLKIKSYKDLHYTLYQITNKYRDEEKVKNSISRKKEFIMADAYSFDTNESLMNLSYDNMFSIYSKIFKRMNINYAVCESDTWSMKGQFAEEFHSICENGEDEIIMCSNCSYKANRNIAEVVPTKPHNNLVNKKVAKVYTPNVRTIKEVSKFLDINIDNIIKSLIYKVDNRYVLVLMRGNDEVNITKLRKILDTPNISLAKDEEIESMGGCIGFVGPIKATMEVIADNNIRYLINGVCGSNIKNYHYINVTPKVDFKVDRYCDLKIIDENDRCPRCDNKIELYRTMEIANIFKLGTIFSDIFDLKYSDEKNEYNRVYMGSYGIGVDRCLYSIVENNHDDNGIIWPIDVAPYKVAIVVVNALDNDANDYAEKLYDKLINLNIDTILDDRKESVGVKFKDIDLIGIPIRITIGFKLSEGKVELKLRNEDIALELDKLDVLDKIKEIMN